jgi:hypothetical protein
MKSKKLLFSTLLMLGGIATFITMSSNSGGKMGVAASGCAGGGCHGALSTSTTMLMQGSGNMLTANQFTPGANYTISVVLGSSTAKSEFGFDISASAGNIPQSGAPANSMAMGNELHHTSPFAATVLGTSSGAVFTFDWTAPPAATAPASITFNISANAVNSNGNSSGDEWNKASFTFTKAVLAAVSNVENTQFNLYPNPATEYLTINTDATIQSVKAISLTGSMLNLTVSKFSNNEYRVDTKTLATGAYILLINDGKHTSHKKFIKQ